MYEIENNMPQFIQKRMHVKKAVIKPEDGRTCTEKVCVLCLRTDFFVLFLFSLSHLCYVSQEFHFVIIC